MATQPDNIETGSRLPQSGRVLPLSIAASAPSRDSQLRHGGDDAANLRDIEIEAGVQRYLARVEARNAAIRAEAIKSLQPGRYETWAMLVIVMASVLFMFWVSAK